MTIALTRARLDARREYRDTLGHAVRTERYIWGPRANLRRVLVLSARSFRRDGLPVYLAALRGEAVIA